MPKIIENVREQLLEEAQRQLAQYGYAKTTIRSVAQACGIAVGTVYNYFPSKEMLIASFMAEDWVACLAPVRTASTEDPEAFLKALCEALSTFMKKHEALFRDSKAEKTFAAVFPSRHKMLRSQIAELIRPFTTIPGGSEPSSTEDPAFTAEFIAESLLTWTVAGVPFDKQYALIRKLIP